MAPSADGVLGEFADAQVYSITTSGGPLPSNMEVRLRFIYDGDCARLYTGESTDRLSIAADHFFNGHYMEFPLTREGWGMNASDSFTLRILPLAKNAAAGSPFPWGPVLFQQPPAFNASGVAIGLRSVEAVHVVKLTLIAQA